MFRARTEWFVPRWMLRIAAITAAALAVTMVQLLGPSLVPAAHADTVDNTATLDIATVCNPGYPDYYVLLTGAVDDSTFTAAKQEAAICHLQEAVVQDLLFQRGEAYTRYNRQRELAYGTTEVFAGLYAAVLSAITDPGLSPSSDKLAIADYMQSKLLAYRKSVAQYTYQEFQRWRASPCAYVPPGSSTTSDSACANPSLIGMIQDDEASLPPYASMVGYGIADEGHAQAQTAQATQTLAEAQLGQQFAAISPELTGGSLPNIVIGSVLTPIITAALVYGFVLALAFQSTTAIAGYLVSTLAGTTFSEITTSIGNEAVKVATNSIVSGGGAATIAAAAITAALFITMEGIAVGKYYQEVDQFSADLDPQPVDFTTWTREDLYCDSGAQAWQAEGEPAPNPSTSPQPGWAGSFFAPGDEMYDDLITDGVPLAPNCTLDDVAAEANELNEATHSTRNTELFQAFLESVNVNDPPFTADAPPSAPLPTDPGFTLTADGSSTSTYAQSITYQLPSYVGDALGNNCVA